MGAVIFDEFHERSLNADLGLALCLEIAGALRDDLILMAMSATLDTAPVADLMGAPVITAEGRAYPVAIRHLPRPRRKEMRFEAAMADLIAEAADETAGGIGGGILAFLPGEGEIRRVEALLRGRLPEGCHIRPLYGALPFARQRAAVAPQAGGRKLVLATAIAETSLTIEDIRVVVDGGLARRARFDPASGMSRLVTERATRAEATQRTGRAGRVAEGVCYRLWSKGEEGALAAHPPAEIEAADLAGLALELALWGAGPAQMPFLTPPNPGHFDEARALLAMLGALDGRGAITAHGRALAGLPLHPRLAHMLTLAGAQAAPLAALLAERDPLARLGGPVDLTLRLKALKDPPPDTDRGTLARIRAEAGRLARGAKNGREGTMSAGAMAALAYPDRVGLRRAGDAPRYLLAGGAGAVLPEGDPLGAARLIVATDLDGDRREARIRQAASLSEAELRTHFGPDIAWHDLCVWDRREGRVIARRQEKFGALVLDGRIWTDAPPDAVARAMLDGVRALGLVWSDAARRLAARVELLRSGGEDFPDFSEAGLMANLEDWLLPHLGGVRSAGDWRRFDIRPALAARLGRDRMQRLDAAAPAHFTSPLGRRIPIDYGGEHPAIALRLQEMFGQSAHPRVGGTPLRVTLLSPAGRPLQTTLDLPGFWAGAYTEVRKEMRGRYPRHPWPEDPAAADPTLRARRRRDS